MKLASALSFLSPTARELTIQALFPDGTTLDLSEVELELPDMIAQIGLSDATGVILGVNVLGRVGTGIVLGDGVTLAEDLAKTVIWLPWSNKSANFAAVDRGRYRMTDDIVATLPASPAAGFEAIFADVAMEWNVSTPSTLNRNGNQMNGGTNNFSLNAAGKIVTVSYDGTSYRVNT